MKNDKGNAERELMAKYLCEPLAKHVRPLPVPERVEALFRPFSLSDIKYDGQPTKTDPKTTAERHL